MTEDGRLLRGNIAATRNRINLRGYDSDGDGSRDANWATDWQDAHTEDVDWYSCGCAHSQSLNCNQKAFATWTMWASLAGWNGANAAVTAGKTASGATIR